MKFFLILVLLGDVACGVVGTVWDARAQWSDYFNPTGVWSYYDASSGNLLIRAGGGTVGGGPAGWSRDGTADSIPSLFNDDWTLGGSQNANEFAGHGPWMVRWTSPVAGSIKITGAVWQKFSIERRVACRLRLNNSSILAKGYVQEDQNGNTILGRTGIYNLTPIYHSVQVGDTLDMIVDGSSPGGDGENTFAVGSFRLEEVGIAISPYPADNDQCAAKDVVLTWTPAADTLSHNVYFGTDFNVVSNASDPAVLPGRGNQLENSFNPGQLAYGTTYYWRIDEISQTAVHRGAVWNFQVVSDWYADAYRLWIEDGTKRVFPTARPDSYPTDPAVQLSLARGEYESFQVVLLPLPGVSLCNVSLQASDMVNGNDGISADNIEWHQVGYVYMTDTYVEAKAPYMEEGAGDGWWPEMLLPVDGFALSDANHAQPVWVTVYAPPDTPAGQYSGTVTVISPNCPPTVIDVTITVYDFTLAKGAGHCKTAFALRHELVDPYQYLEYADFTLKHRLNPDHIYRYGTPSISNLEYFFEQGMNSFTILNVEYQDEQQTINLIDSFLSQLQTSPYAVQLRDMAQFYGYDEIEGEGNFEVMRTRFLGLEANYPDIERVTTARMHSFIPPYGSNDPIDYMEYYGVDRFVPITHFYDYSNGQALRSAGMEQWGYVCSGPYKNHYANFHTYYPLIESRLIWWQMYQQKMDGFLYYNVAAGSADGSGPVDQQAGPFTGFVYDSVNPPGDGVLLYTGTVSPIASVRLANIRDGIEDYEYLWTLARKTGDFEKVRKVCEPVVWGLHTDPSFTHDAAVVQTVRDEIARMIVSQKAILPEPADETTNTELLTDLGWVAGTEANSHDIYFGTDYAEVVNAQRLTGDVDGSGSVDWDDLLMIAGQWIQPSPFGQGPLPDLNNDDIIDYQDFGLLAGNWQAGGSGVYKGRYPLDVTQYEPCELDYGTPYFWRIDEVSGGTVHKGDVWSFTTRPHSWDAKSDWSDSENPHVLALPPYGIWSYRSIDGEPLIQAPGGTMGGGPAGWSLDGTDSTIPTLFDDNWIGGGSEPHNPDEFAGHGPWMVRWTSPMTGAVNINGSLWQKFEPARRLRYQLSHNGVVFSVGYMPEDTGGNTIIGRSGIINFGPIARSVAATDTIELMVDGNAPGSENNWDTFAVATFRIEPQ